MMELQISSDVRQRIVDVMREAQARKDAGEIGQLRGPTRIMAYGKMYYCPFGYFIHATRGGNELMRLVGSTVIELNETYGLSFGEIADRFATKMENSVAGLTARPKSRKGGIIDLID